MSPYSCSVWSLKLNLLINNIFSAAKQFCGSILDVLSSQSLSNQVVFVLPSFFNSHSFSPSLAPFLSLSLFVSLLMSLPPSLLPYPMLFSHSVHLNPDLWETPSRWYFYPSAEVLCTAWHKHTGSVVFISAGQKTQLMKNTLRSRRCWAKSWRTR